VAIPQHLAFWITWIRLDFQYVDDDDVEGTEDLGEVEEDDQESSWDESVEGEKWALLHFC